MLNGKEMCGLRLGPLDPELIIRADDHSSKFPLHVGWGLEDPVRTLFNKQTLGFGLVHLSLNP